MIELHNLSNSDIPEWDDFVQKCENSTFYHQIGWKNIIERTYGHKSYYIIGKEDSKIVGVLPLFLIKSRLFGSKVVSVPFGPYGGPLANDVDIRQLLVNEAIRLCKKYDAKYLELRLISNEDYGLRHGNPCTTSIINLPATSEDLFKSFSRNKRKTIYKSQKRDLEAKWSKELSNFYGIYYVNMHNLGSPVHSKKFFESILNEFPDSAKVLTVYYKDTPVYSAFYQEYRDTIINSWSSAVEDYRAYFPTDFGIWYALKYACNKGLKYYDLGRSQPNSANLEFKRRWGAEIIDLNYRYYFNKVDNTGLESDSSKRNMFENIWRMIPLPLANKIGPLIRRHFP